MIVSVYNSGDEEPKNYEYPKNKQKIIIGRNPKCE